MKSKLSHNCQLAAQRLLLAFALLTAGTATAQNFVSNPDFEQPLGPDNWAVAYDNCGPFDFLIAGRSTMAHKDTVPGAWDADPPGSTNYLSKQGGHFAPNYCNGLMHAYFKQVITGLTPGSNYACSAWMVQYTRNDNYLARSQVYMEVLGGPNLSVSKRTPYVTDNANNNPAGWKQYGLTGTASQNGEIELRLHYAFVQTIAQTWEYRNINAYYDHVEVRSVTEPGTVRVTNNLMQASFALTGPANHNGVGFSTTITNTPPGQYVVTFGDVPHFQTPAPQTNSLSPGGEVSFAGNYTFTDANVNAIPDSYELEVFGVVDPLRTKSTDTDCDGMSDWAEFVAGTNPNNPPPPFRITADRLADELVQLSWPSVMDHTYRIHVGVVSPTALWPATDWFPSDGTNTTFLLPAFGNFPWPLFFRVEAAPPGGSNALPAGLKVKASLPSPDILQLDWPSAAGHGYRVLGSANATSWAPYSEWLRATGLTTTWIVPPHTNGAPYLFRVEARP
jgi:hypothetical protein